MYVYIYTMCIYIYIVYMYVCMYMYIYQEQREPSKLTVFFLSRFSLKKPGFLQVSKKTWFFSILLFLRFCKMMPNVCSIVQNYDAFPFALPIPVLPAMLHLFLLSVAQESCFNPTLARDHQSALQHANNDLLRSHPPRKAGFFSDEVFRDLDCICKR